MLRVVGRPMRADAAETPRGPAPESIRELAFIDRINEVRPPQHRPPSEQLPRLYDEDYAILALLDRAGPVLPSLIGRAVLPGREPKTIRHRLSKLYEHGLVARSEIGLRARTSADGRLPWLYTLTRHGIETAQAPQPAGDPPAANGAPSSSAAPARSPTTCTRSPGRSSSTALVGELATDYWRTPRYATGRYPVPQIGNGHKRHPITMRELAVPEGHAVLDLAAVSRDQTRRLARTAHPQPAAHLRPARRTRPHRPPLLQPRKLRAYDAFLTGWALAHPRYRALGTRPVVVFVSRDQRTALANARTPTGVMTDESARWAAAAEWSAPAAPHLLRRRGRHAPRIARRARAVDPADRTAARYEQLRYADTQQSRAVPVLRG